MCVCAALHLSAALLRSALPGVRPAALSLLDATNSSSTFFNGLQYYMLAGQVSDRTAAKDPMQCMPWTHAWQWCAQAAWCSTPLRPPTNPQTTRTKRAAAQGMHACHAPPRGICLHGLRGIIPGLAWPGVQIRSFDQASTLCGQGGGMLMRVVSPTHHDIARRLCISARQGKHRGQGA